MQYFKLLVTLLVLLPTIGAANVKCYVNKRNSVGTIAMEAIYLGYKTHWKNGSLISVGLGFEEQGVADSYISRKLGITTIEFNSRWRRKLFSGQGTSPINFDSAEKFFNFIHNNRNAVGCTSFEAISNKRIKEVKVQ